MMATVPHVTSGSGLRKFQAHGFLFDRVYQTPVSLHSNKSSLIYFINKFQNAMCKYIFLYFTIRPLWVTSILAALISNTHCTNERNQQDYM